jgi:hypothetical protein
MEPEPWLYAAQDRRADDAIELYYRRTNESLRRNDLT